MDDENNDKKTKVLEQNDNIIELPLVARHFKKRSTVLSKLDNNNISSIQTNVILSLREELVRLEYKNTQLIYLNRKLEKKLEKKMNYKNIVI